MRSFGFRLAFLVAILWAGIGSTVWALGHQDQPVETVYLMPSSATLPVPTSYVVSTSWLEPTAYAVPTYYTTAYWMDPVVLAQPTYAPTEYVRRGGLFGRRWVVERPVLATYTTSYVPTAYYASSPAYRATSYALADRLVVPSAYFAPADCICPPALASAAPAYTAPQKSAGSAASGAVARPRTRQSEPDDRSSMRSDVGPPPADLNPYRSGGAREEIDNTAQEQVPARLPDITDTARDNTPPPPPARIRAQSNLPSEANTQGGQIGQTPIQSNIGQGQAGGAQGRTAGAQGQAGGAQGQAGGAQGQAGGAQNQTGGPQGQAGGTGAAPTAPDGSDTNPPALGPAGEIRRDSMRPNYAMRPATRSRYPNVLIGTVLSGSDNQPEEGVRVIVRNAATGSDKTTTTNAFGRFAVRLADGDWVVDVTMPSGRVYEVSQIRVAQGEITDSLGRRVPSLEITR